MDSFRELKGVLAKKNSKSIWVVLQATASAVFLAEKVCDGTYSVVEFSKDKDFNFDR